VDRDLVGVRALRHVALRDLDVLRLDVARVDVPAFRERRGHRERRVAGEGADLEHAGCAGAEDEQLEEAALDRPGQHLRRGHRRACLLGQPLQQLGRLRRVSLGVLLELLVDEEAHRSTREPPTIASRPSPKRTSALPLPS
jgi:hypothetical protein